MAVTDDKRGLASLGELRGRVFPNKEGLWHGPFPHPPQTRPFLGHHFLCRPQEVA